MLRRLMNYSRMSTRRRRSRVRIRRIRGEKVVRSLRLRNCLMHSGYLTMARKLCGGGGGSSTDGEEE